MVSLSSIELGQVGDSAGARGGGAGIVGGDDGAVEGVGGAEGFIAARGVKASKSPVNWTQSPSERQGSGPGLTGLMKAWGVRCKGFELDLDTQACSQLQYTCGHMGLQSMVE